MLLELESGRIDEPHWSTARTSVEESDVRASSDLEVSIEGSLVDCGQGCEK
jgi:hypothetical protein